MQTHVAIAKDKCKNCKEVQEATAGRSFLGWLRKSRSQTPVEKRETDNSLLDVSQIIERRLEWKAEIEKRKAKREQLEFHLALARV